jgi:hypothetical protein
MTTVSPETEIASLRKSLQSSQAELRALKRSAADSAELAALRRARIDHLEEKLERFKNGQGQVALRDEHIASLEEQMRQTDHQLHLLRRSFVVRAWNRLRRVPPLSWIVARRSRG